MQTDNQLIRRIKKKQDKKAADEPIRRYYREIYAFTYRQTGERELALDLTQEIFITVLQGIYAFDEKKAGFRTLSFSVLRSTQSPAICPIQRLGKSQFQLLAVWCQ